MFAGDIGADVGSEAGFLGGEVETRGAVEAVAVEQRHGGELILGGDGDQVLGQGRAFEEAEGGAGMEFDVHKSDNSPQRHPSTALRAGSDTEKNKDEEKQKLSP